MARITARHNVKRQVVAIVIIAVFGSCFGTFASGDQKLSDAFKQLNELKKEMANMNTMMVPVGTIMPYAGSREKNEKKLKAKGWLFCHGDKLEREKYKELYLVIQTAFGNPDPDNKFFNLPDLRGRFVRGVNHGKGRDPDVRKRTNESGEVVGGQVGSLQGDLIGEHQHSIHSKHAGLMGGKSPHDPPAVAGWSNHPTERPHTEKTGGAETRPRNIYVNWIIKAHK